MQNLSGSGIDAHRSVGSQQCWVDRAEWVEDGQPAVRTSGGEDDVYAGICSSEHSLGVFGTGQLVGAQESAVQISGNERNHYSLPRPVGVPDEVPVPAPGDCIDGVRDGDVDGLFDGVGDPLRPVEGDVLVGEGVCPFEGLGDLLL